MTTRTSESGDPTGRSDTIASLIPGENVELTEDHAVRTADSYPRGERGPALGDGDGGARSAWTGLRTFWITAFVLLAVLVAFAVVIDNGHVAVPDDGVYAAQVDGLSNGSWSTVRPAENIDEGGLNSAIGPGVVMDSRQIPYERHPLFSLSLLPLYNVAGFLGLMLFSVIGVWGAAVSAGLLARRIHPSFGLVALLITAVVSPLIFDSFLVSAHGMGAAMAGFAVLGISQSLDDRKWYPLAYAMPAVALLVALRSEGFILALALGVAVAAAAVWHLLKRAAWRREGSVALAVLVTASAAFILDSKASQAITSQKGFDTQPLSRVLGEHTGPWTAVWSSVLRPWFDTVADSYTSFALSAICIILAALCLKLWPKRWLLAIGLLLLSMCCMILQQFSEPTLVSGFIPVFPASIAGLILLTRSNLRDPLVGRVLVVSALTFVALVPTMYDNGGGTEWGGRFFHVLIPALVPVAVVGLDNGRLSKL